MANKNFRERVRKYLDADFDTFRSSLIDNHVKVFYPDLYKDFRETSPGMMLLESVAFIGDAISFNLDKKFQEVFLQSAQEDRNIYKVARMLGYKPRGPAPAFGPVDLFATIPAINSGSAIVPDLDYALRLLRGTVLRAQNGVTYELADETDFAKLDLNSLNQVRVKERDGVGNPTFYAFKASGSAIAGETKTTEITIGSFQKFRRIALPSGENVLEVVNVRDSEGNDWFEVDYLAQDTIFDGVKNNDSDNDIIPYVLKLKFVPRRFVTETDPETGITYLRFGAGEGINADEELIPNLADLSVPLIGKTNFSDFAIDPQNFLKTRTLGLAPSNTTLTVKYRMLPLGFGSNTNAGVGDINAVTDPVYELRISNPVSSKLASVLNSLSANNPNPLSGGDDGQTTADIKLNAQAFFAAQNRVVTREDFISRVLSMPSRFGSVFRAQVRRNCENPNGVEIFILTKDVSGNVVAPTVNLKNNIKTYLSKYRELTTGVDLLDGTVINVAVRFEIVVKPSFNKTEVLATVLNRVKDYFDINKWQLGQPIILSKLENVIDDTAGVLSTFNLEISNRIGTFEGRTYSQKIFNVMANTRNGIIYVPEESIIELKYPNLNILGVAK